MRIDLTDDLKKQAIEMAENRFRMPYRDPESDNQNFNMILMACVGELAFQKYLTDNNIRFDLVGDLQRDIAIGETLFEIRTSGFNFDFDRLNFIYNVNQYKSRNEPVDYVVQIFVNGYKPHVRSFDIELSNLAHIVGFIEFDEIVNLVVDESGRGKHYRTSLINLRPLTELL